MAVAPWTAFTLLGVDMYELAGTIAQPGDLLGDRADQLAGALAALPNWEQRFDLLDEVLSAWIDHGCTWSPGVQWAYQELYRTRGAISIPALAEGAGWRQRQLEYRFREQIGLSPKAVAKVFRFRHAVRLLTDGWTPAQTAAACGFSDQAHLTREFTATTGLTPGSFRVKALTTAYAQVAAERTARHVRTPMVLAI